VTTGHARASGVEREPGQTTTSRSPNRIHSSNNVAAYWPAPRSGSVRSVQCHSSVSNVAARAHPSCGCTASRRPRTRTSVSFHSGRNVRASDCDCRDTAETLVFRRRSTRPLTYSPTSSPRSIYIGGYSFGLVWHSTSHFATPIACALWSCSARRAHPRPQRPRREATKR